MVAGSTLDQRVGDYMSGDGSHGAHGGSHGAHGHKEFHEMSPTDFLEQVKGIHRKGNPVYIEDYAKRAEKAAELHKEYIRHHSRLEQEINADFEKIDLTKIKPIHDKIKDAYKHNEHELLSDIEAEEHLKSLLDVILPEIGYGVKGKTEEMHNSFQSYLSELKQMRKEDAENLERQLDDAIKTGDGMVAAQKVMEIMKMYKSTKYRDNILQSLLNREDKDFTEKYAEHIAEKIEEKTGGKVRTPLILSDIANAAMNYAHGGYLEIANKYKRKEKTHADAHDGAAHQ